MRCLKTLQLPNHTLAQNGNTRGTGESPDNSPEGGATCWWAPFAAMGCFGSASSKQTAGSDDSEDKVSQKKRSDAITKQLQKDKQVILHNSIIKDPD